MDHHGSSCCGRLDCWSERCESKLNPVGPLDEEKFAAAVLLYIFNRAFISVTLWKKKTMAGFYIQINFNKYFLVGPDLLHAMFTWIMHANAVHYYILPSQLPTTISHEGHLPLYRVFLLRSQYYNLTWSRQKDKTNIDKMIEKHDRVILLHPRDVYVLVSLYIWLTIRYWSTPVQMGWLVNNLPCQEWIINTLIEHCFWREKIIYWSLWVFSFHWYNIF